MILQEPLASQKRILHNVNNNIITLKMFNIDIELARAAEDSLTLGEHEVRRIDDRFRRPRQNYARLYAVALPPPPPNASLLNSPVPGFPDFPECWQGVEGGAAQAVPVGFKGAGNNNKQKKTPALRKTQLWKRETVNRHACQRKRTKAKYERGKCSSDKIQPMSAISCKLASLTIRNDAVQRDVEETADICKL